MKEIRLTENNMPAPADCSVHDFGSDKLHKIREIREPHAQKRQYVLFVFAFSCTNTYIINRLGRY